MRTLKYIPILILLALFCVWFGLIYIDEPERVRAWYMTRRWMRIFGGLFVLGALASIIISKGKAGRAAALTFSLGIIAIMFPTLVKVLGFAYPADINLSAPTLTVHMPLSEPAIVTWGGNTVETNYHAAFPDQRWAYDLVVAPHGMGTKTLTDYGCFGKPVLAPTAGTILKTVINEPDQTPSNTPEKQTNPFGNHVIITPDGTDNKLVIAHLKQGSINVSKGDAVNAGTPIGACGNSGNSSEPHVHMHYSATRQAKDDLYYTYGLPLYFHGEDGAFMPTGGFTRKGGNIIWNNNGIAPTLPKP